MKIKICGITNQDDAIACARLGADALGFNFYRKSPRYVEPTRAKEIVKKLPAEVLSVGVFVNEDLEQVLKIAETVNLRAIQLHGDESPDYLWKARQRSDKILIKVFRIGEKFESSTIREYNCDAILLDSYKAYVFGGTGEVFDWEIGKRISSTFDKTYLAGGLSTKNVVSAIEKVKPYGVDVCSGVEKRKGIKDLGLVEEFIKLAKGKKV